LADKGPPEATVARRSKSYSDFYDIVKAQLAKDDGKKKRRRRRKHGAGAALDALLAVEDAAEIDHYAETLPTPSTNALLEASQQEYL